MSVAVLIGMLGVAGCAQVNALKSKVQGHSTTTTVAPATPSGIRPVLSFDAIVNELQLGRYNDGERHLRQYLALHPGDRPAQAMLHQLTADPRQSLGTQSSPYVVQPGDSYSTLAARYLGDPGAFLILARYNGSTNPSLLRTGETVRLPVSTPLAAGSAALGSTTEVPAASVSGTLRPSGDQAPSNELPTARAQRLQRESISLLDQGRNDQALARLGEALSIEPRLKPAGPQAAALREQLLASYHQRAIVLYRDQHLDQAISLWDRILVINPSYEPAVIYRARALELKHRLKQI